MNKMSRERLEIYWKDYQLGRLRVLFEHVESRVGEFIQDTMAGKSLKEREQERACFYAYVRGVLRQEAWQTPVEWEAAYREELPAEALVWIRWQGDASWQPARWRDAKRFSTGALEALVCRGYEEPPRPDREQLKAERRRTIGL